MMTGALLFLVSAEATSLRPFLPRADIVEVRLAPPGKDQPGFFDKLFFEFL